MQESSNNTSSWYEVIESDDLKQGDLITSVPIIYPFDNIEPGSEIKVPVITTDVLILSQSCDLEQHRSDLITVCKCKPYQDAKNETEIKGKFDDICKGRKYGYCILKNHTGEIVSDFIVAYFYEIFVIPIAIIKERIKDMGKRLRLKPPYREYLSQEFARLIMRVALKEPVIFTELS